MTISLFFNLFYSLTFRFDNILGKETIHTLQYLTTEVTSIFCHPSLVNRIAAMLNYFLTHLVGPEKKKFKVTIAQHLKTKSLSVLLVFISL